ncbi:MAG: lamin tail domain-containing protein [Clostridiales bacterium]|nr:lamin tail domain-containing protein [Clostridiales bacterium]MDY4895021.1 lamin tail domain-containing protein [Christensenellaceae bacterium]
MKKKRLSAIFMALALCVSLSAATACSASDNGEKPGSGIDAPGGNTGDDGNAGGGTVPPDGGKTNKNALNKVANFSTGFTSADGGVAEIVKYNEDNGKFYLVNGKTQTLDIVTLRTLADDKTQLETVFTEETDRISFDSLAASEFKEHFNCSNDDVKLDSRSKKKGPEPESVEVAEIDGKRYAFVGLERTGGVMMFDITDFLKGKAALSAYANSRDYSLPMAGDVAPEGLGFLPAEKSPTTGKALLFVANENSGAVAVYALEEETKTYRMYETFIPAPDDGDHGKTGSSTLVIYSVYGSGGNTDGTVSHNFIAIKNISENEIDLTGYTVSYSENGTDLAEKSLSGSIAAGEVYIIRCAAANTTSAVINIADTDDNSADFEAVSFKGEAQGSEKATTYMKKLGLE